MVEVKISSFINDLIFNEDRHPLYQETLSAYLAKNSHTISDESKVVNAKKIFLFTI